MCRKRRPVGAGAGTVSRVFSCGWLARSAPGSVTALNHGVT